MIDLFKPSLGIEELKEIENSFETGWVGLGPKTKEFEKEFSDYIGVKYAVGLNSATSALDLSLKLLGVNHGDEVIVPTMTFISTAHVVSYNLATPIFVDVDENLLLDFDDLKNKITPRTKAVIPVHYAGRPLDIYSLKNIIGDIPIIEDCAHACGSAFNKQKCGSFGIMGAFSFHAVKNLCTGDGGMITTNCLKIYERAKKLRWLGIDKNTWDRTDNNKSYWWKYDVSEIGLKCHMNDINASIGLVQLKKLDKMNSRRRQIAERYTNGLNNLGGVLTPMMDTDISKSSWHIYCIRCSNRNDLSVYMKEKGIMTGVHYKPIHLYNCYGNIPTLPKSEEYFEKILSLPIHPNLTDDEVNLVINTIHNFYEGN